ncbi:MAG TPA: metallophosphoesterase [Clostridia bacterium]|nr:metallophosphoesterase [Clostridia bacterium]
MKHLITGAVSLCAAGAAYGYYQNNVLQVTRHALDIGLSTPIKLVCLADLHGKQFGKNNSRLIEQVRNLAPDLIVFPGDTLSADCHHLSATVKTLRALSRIAPCFLIAGNHEHRSGRWAEIAAKFRAAGVVVLENTQFDGNIHGVPLHIMGLDEGLAVSRLDYVRAACKTLRYTDNRACLRDLSQQDGLRIVLSHFPEYYALIGELSYCRFPFDLMLCGHAHGGQVRLGKRLALFAPGQGLFPRFCQGMHGSNPSLLVSRGLGNDSPLPRVNNRPEIVSVTIM